MGHRVFSTETFPEKPESECYKRLGFENDSFDANKRLKQDFASSEGPFFSVTRNAHVYDCRIAYPDTCEKASQQTTSTEECSFPIYEFAPRKAIPIGSNHQADIPEFNAKVTEEDYEKWIRGGILEGCDLDKVWKDGKECDCEDMRSARCFRQHINEVREDMKKKLGLERFVKLGFGEMGEEVASTWNPQDEKLFTEIVRSNPASFMKNFWDVLPLAFPEKCKHEFVSYYFNVYILRKRAGQNHSDPLYIDSDDDQWEVSSEEERVESDDELEEMMHNNGEEEYNSEEEIEEGEEEENGSGLESPIDQITCYGDYIISSEVIEEAEENGDGKDDKFLERTDGSDRPEGVGIQDDSCTSFEAQHDQMSWDAAGFEHTKKDELYTTFDVIEEVFGKGSGDK